MLKVMGSVAMLAGAALLFTAGKYSDITQMGTVVMTGGGVVVLAIASYIWHLHGVDSAELARVDITD